MKKILGLALIVSLAACGGNDKPAQEVKQAPLVQSKNSAAFNSQFDKLMDDYFQLKDNFISEKDSAITTYAKAIIADVDSLNLKELKADTSVIGTAKSFVIDISKEANGINSEKPTTLDIKRQHFQILSDKLFDLARTVQYDNQKVYQDHCPMAFGEKGANWLSKSSEIENPYLPKKMLTCGEVTDSIGK
ncbi:DUF3347 domain-containing protein [Parasediminibacterium paludis]|uniref:DUF3347 domain-containing protein n=1 Tax=Parasediminibacterium paludis TaxID=908966 RepID=A0ABV8PQI7_9BACT